MSVLKWVVVGLLATVLSLQAEWKRETVYDASFMWYMGDRYMVQATDGTIHVAAGGDSLYHLWHDGSQWYRETVDQYWSGSQASLAMDASGNLHIAYLNWKNNDLMYATNQSGSWVTQVVDAADDTGWYTSIAVDGSGKVHISYTTYTASGWQLMYASGGNGTWTSETVDASVPYVGEETSLQVDAYGVPHISYVDASSKSLKYATKSSGLWLLQAVDSVTSYNGVTDTSLALKGDGTVAIAYGAGNGVKLATQSSAGWTLQTVADIPWTWDVTFAEDAAGQEHIAYSHSGALGYATNISGIWQQEQIQGMPHADIGLLVDTNAKVHMMAGSYFDDLMYVTNSGGVWQVQTAAENNWVGYDQPAGLDGMNNLHVLHVTDKNEMIYSTNASGQWVNEVVMNDTLSRVTPEMAVAADGSVHGVYALFGYPLSQLFYVTNRDGNWTTELIGDSQTATPKIVVGSDGVVKVVFLKDGALQVASRTAAGWQTAEVAAGHFTPYYFGAVTLDATDRLHIAVYEYELIDGFRKETLSYYYDSGTQWVKEKIAGAGNYVYDIRIAVDAQNKAHVVYCEILNNSSTRELGVGYASNVSGTWYTEPIDTWLYTTGGAAIAVDSQGKAHITYMKWDDGLLYYANNRTGSWVIESFGDVGWGGYNSIIMLDDADFVHIVHPDWDHADILYTYQPSPTAERVDYPGNSENGILCNKGDRGAQVLWDEEGHHVYAPGDANKAVGKKSSEQLFYNTETGQCEPRK